MNLDKTKGKRRAFDEDEVVADSEPEREEKRRQRREERKRRHRYAHDQPDNNSNKDGGSSYTSSPASVEIGLILERISQSGRADAVAPMISSSQPSRLEESEARDQFVERTPILAEDGEKLEGPIPETTNSEIHDELSSHLSARSSYVSLPPIAFLPPPSDTETEQTTLRFDIHRFAYQDVRPAHTKLVPTDTDSSSNPHALPPLSTLRKWRDNNPAFLAQISDADWVKLRKCISCELRWTSKKTRKQKHLHVSACAKKHLLSEDTVHLLIRKEIGAVTKENDLMKDEQTAKEALQKESDATYLDAVVKDTAVKRRRRWKVLTTVKSLPETRHAILHRAHALLQSSSLTTNDDECMEGSDASKKRKAGHPLSSGDGIPQTQAFGVSALQQPAKSLTARLVDVRSSLADDTAPPCTQPFGPSNLAACLSPVGS